MYIYFKCIIYYYYILNVKYYFEYVFEYFYLCISDKKI